MAIHFFTLFIPEPPLKPIPGRVFNPSVQVFLAADTGAPPLNTSPILAFVHGVRVFSQLAVLSNVDLLKKIFSSNNPQKPKYSVSEPIINTNTGQFGDEM